MGVIMSLLRDPAMQRRCFTIAVVAPTVSWLIWRVWGLTVAAWLLHFIGLIEWTGVKRHLKLCLLDPLISMEKKAAVAAARDDADNQQELLLLDLPPWPLAEFPVPLAPSTTSILLKCFVCSLIVPALLYDPSLFLPALSIYFFSWVIMTLIDNNRAEIQQAKAKQRLVRERKSRRGSVTRNSWGGASPPKEPSSAAEASLDSASATADSRAAAASPVSPDAAASPTTSVLSGAGTSSTNLPLPEELTLRELEIFSVNPTFEVFLNFALEYFGFVWVSNLAFVVPMFCTGRQGRAWVLITLAANWANDIAALVVGRTLKKFGRKTTQLYPRISPNKSLEGAVVGTLMNAVACVGLAYIFAPDSTRGFYHYPAAAAALNGTAAPEWATRNVAALVATDGDAFNPSLFPESHIGPALAAAPAQFTAWMTSDQAPLAFTYTYGVSPYVVFALLGFALGLIGVVGDLLQSLFKRAARVKDTGSMFPGHGGVLDRIDGLLLSYPVVYWLLWWHQNRFGAFVEMDPIA